MTKLIHYISQGSRIFLTSLKSRYKPKKYPGNAKEICQQVVNNCWNGRFFQTSTTNFPQFWTRDFGWCTKSLLQLGYKEKVHQTLRYAIKRFQAAGKITTTITPRGKPFDFPCPAVDSLPYLIHSIRLSSFPYQQHKSFLNRQVKMFFEEKISPSGLVKTTQFSSMKDFSVRKSSCYDNCMVAMLANDLRAMKLKNPFEGTNYPSLIIKNFWNGNYFFDDLTKKEYVAGDANIMPFVLGVIRDEDMLSSCLQEVQKAGLDHPFPLKYTNTDAQAEFVPEEFFLKNYEQDSIWTHMGLFYIKLLKEVKPSLAEKHHQTYTSLIERYGNYLEVFSANDSQVRPFRTKFYYCDQGMLWAANYLTLQ
ncbi:MAG: hypothetical protein ABIA37_04990 [Candidatus Woesearchaeota archaeon]